MIGVGQFVQLGCTGLTVGSPVGRVPAVKCVTGRPVTVQRASVWPDGSLTAAMKVPQQGHADHGGIS